MKWSVFIGAESLTCRARPGTSGAYHHGSQGGDAAGTFAGKVSNLEPDIVVDMICFTRDSARHLVDALRGKVALLKKSCAGPD